MDLPYSNIWSAFGLLTLGFCGLKLLKNLIKGIIVYVLAKPMNLGLDLRKMGEWAAVTGATDGIGKGYARNLAKRGLNVVLISRNPEKLKNVAAEIEKEFNVKTHCVTVDFSNDADTVYNTIEPELKKFEIGTLVNNIGTSYEHPEYLHKVENGLETFRNMIRINCTSQALVTRAVLPQMVERRKGVVINLSSASALYPTGLLSVYSASKAFNDFFSKGMAQEYRDMGIIFQSVLPFYVVTPLSKLKRPNFFQPTPDVYTDYALSTVGLTECTHGYLPHALQSLSFVAPDWFKERLQWSFVSDVRRRALKKKEREQKKE